MIQVNMHEAKTGLSHLVKSLENKEHDRILIARDGKPVAELILIETQQLKTRIGAAKGKFKVPEEFDSWDGEIEEMFERL